MKKTYLHFLIILLVPVVLLAACGNKRPSLDDRVGDVVQEVKSSYEGTLERLESLDVYQQGTHVLKTLDDGDIILQSPSIDLNRYLNEEVLVKGILEKGVGDAKDVYTVTEISYIDESKSADLADYESKLYGFRFTYPSTWILSEGQGDLSLQLGEQEVVNLAVFSDKTDLDAFVVGREDGEPTEVTIGAQRSLRYVRGSGLSFYVPSPPKKKIYLISFTPTVNSVDDPKAAEGQLEMFYDLLDSFELIYLTQSQGDKCGGLKQIKCPEEQICQLDSDGKYAEGVCVAIGGEANIANCPFIAPPAGCKQYRISEYNQKGCPSRYECVEAGSSDAVTSFRDLNTVDAGKVPDDYEMSDETEADSDSTENTDEKTDADEEKTYEVPDLSDLTYRYENSRKEFSILMPKTWYYVSFGPADGTDWLVGFSDVEFEEVEDAIITLRLTEESDSKISKKIGDVYYNLHAPTDLTEVIIEMLGSIEAS